MNKTIKWAEVRDIETSECGEFCDSDVFECPNRFFDTFYVQECCRCNSEILYTDKNNSFLRSDWCREHEVKIIEKGE